MTAPRTPALFLDRDGTINRTHISDGKPFAPVRVEDFEILPGVVEVVSRVRAGGFPVIVVTNQPDLTTGKQTAESLAAINAVMQKQVAVDDVFVCPHTEAQGCDCRKPKPGLIMAASAKWNVDLSRSVMVGDRSRDVLAGQAAGCYTVYIDGHYDEPRPERADRVVASLAEAEEFIIGVLKGGYFAG